MAALTVSSWPAMKVRVEAADVFHYPDEFVTCDPDDTEAYFKEHPTVIFEVLSASTEGTDRREKFLSYELLESLRESVLVHQDRRAVEVFRREAPAGSAWAKFVRAGDENVTFVSLNVSMTLTQI